MNPRAPAMLGAVLLVLAVASASLQVQWPRRTSAVAQGTAQATSGTASKADPRVLEASAAAHQEVPRSVQQRLQGLAQLRPLSHEPLGPNETEICGVGRARGEADAEALQQRANAMLEPLIAQTRLRMRASADAHVRAAALMVERDAVPLVEMALRSSDPTLYAFAQLACERTGQDPGAEHCRLLSDEQMARLDPDNLVAWLRVAQAAQRRGDTSGAAEAFYRASLSREVRHRTLTFASLAFAALPEAATPQELMLAAVAIFGIQAALPLPYYQPLAQWCAKDVLALDANRRQVCDRVARTMVDHSDTLIDLAIGRRIGEAAGWPAEEVELHSARLHGYSAAHQQHIEHAAGSWLGCEAMGAHALWAERASRIGEVPTARTAVRELGWTDTSMRIRYRAEQARRAVEAAASAPR